MSFLSAPSDGAHTDYMVVEAQRRHRSVPYPLSEEETHMALQPRQPIAVSDISIYICLIDIIQKQVQRTTE